MVLGQGFSMHVGRSRTRPCSPDKVIPALSSPRCMPPFTSLSAFRGCALAASAFPLVFAHTMPYRARPRPVLIVAPFRGVDAPAG